MASIPAQFADSSLSDRHFAAIKPGDLIEWGIPPGLNGRLIPVQFLKHGIPASIWIYHHHGLGVFASSWISHGIDLQRLFFIRSAKPVKELRPLFLEDTFKRIIIDSPKNFSSGDLAFVSQQARKHRQIVFLIRHYFLSQKQGNPHASLRINTWQNDNDEFSLQVIKGPTTGKLRIPLREVYAG